VFCQFSLTGWLVTVACAMLALVCIVLVSRRFRLFSKTHSVLSDLKSGLLSVRNVESPLLFILYSVGIWVSYYLHFYLTFFCFDFTEHLGLGCALVCFVVANFAVIVPTPNGAGPWHFAIKTMLILYGVRDEQALYFVLIVHTVQTLLVVALGIWAWIHLSFTKRLTLKQ
jgi:hypothetical protein